MTTEFALDPSQARRKAGYVQSDVAHLMASHQSRISDLEQGRLLPTLSEIVTFSLIYGRSFESLFSMLMDGARRELQARVMTLPKEVRNYVGTFNRAGSIDRLKDRLAEPNGDHD